MRIEPLNLPSPSQTASPVAVTPAQSFGDLLTGLEMKLETPATAADPALAQSAIQANKGVEGMPAPALTRGEAKIEEQHRAFGFSELSVFGADSVRQAAPAPPSPAAPPLQPGAADAAIDGHAVHTTASASVVEAPPTDKASRNIGDTGRRLSLRVALQQASEPAPRTATAPSLRPAIATPERGGAERAAPSLPRERPAVQAKPFSLTLAEQNGTVQLLAAAGGLVSQDRAAVRRAAAQVLAEFGLNLGEFTLNGETAEPFTISHTGAFDGDQRG